MKHVITLPELQYIAQALHGEVDDPRYAGKNVSGYFSMVFLHDDTKSQLEENVETYTQLLHRGVVQSAALVVCGLLSDTS
jgi:hypothetical protein